MKNPMLIMDMMRILLSCPLKIVCANLYSRIMKNCITVFNHPNSTFFQLKQLLTHTIFSETNPNLQVTTIVYSGAELNNNSIVIKNIFNTKIVHTIMIMAKNV